MSLTVETAQPHAAPPLPGLLPCDLSAPIHALFPYSRPSPDGGEPMGDERGLLLTFALHICRNEPAMAEIKSARESGLGWYCTTADGSLYARLSNYGTNLLVSDAAGSELRLRLPP